MMKMSFVQPLFCFILSVGGAAQASSPTEPAVPATYAVMSLLGNSVSTVVAQDRIGTNMDANNRHLIPVADLVFDSAAVESANETLKKRQPKPGTVLMATRDTGLYQAQNDMFERPEANRENREYLISLLKNRPVTHLILITKLRGQTDVAVANGMTGTGTLEGLGFYMDNNVSTMNTETLHSGRGLLASFAYVKARLIEAKTLDVVREAYVKRSSVVSNSNQNDPEKLAWNILTTQQKVELLDGQVRDAVADLVPKLFKQ